MKHFILTVPKALPFFGLMDALAAAGTPAKVVRVTREGVKVTPYKASDRPAVEAFVRGFIAGFNA